jgi:Tol biopolymer transport system component
MSGGMDSDVLKTCLLVFAVALVMVVTPRQNVLSSGAAQRDNEVSGRLIFSAIPEGEDSSSIYVVDADGSHLQRFIDGADYPNADFPAVSPDGSNVAFASFVDGEWSIYVAQLADGAIYDIDHLTEDDGFFPMWSPDGRHIAFISNRYGWLSLFVMGADGSEPYRLTSMNVPPEYFSWSPNGEAIAITSTQLNVVVVDVRSAQIRQILDYAQAPAWSPDGQTIALSKYADGAWPLVLAQAEDLREHHLLADVANDARLPLWSPDGSKLSFIAYTGETVGAYVIDADGTSLERLNDIIAAVRVWSPDSRYLASVSTCDNHDTIYIAAVAAADGEGNCLAVGDLNGIQLGGWLTDDFQFDRTEG